MEFYFYRMILLLSMGMIPFAKAQELPYEKCNYLNKEFTENIINHSLKIYKGDEEDTEACTTCLDMEGFGDSFSSLVKSLTHQLNKIPQTCFLASMLRSTEKKGSKSKRNYYHCKSPLSPKPTKETFKIYNPETNEYEDRWARRVCLNQSYVTKTRESFHYMADCLGFSSLKEKKDLFALFNHESSFIVNNRSGEDARCYGQLLEKTVEQVDKIIYTKEKAHQQYRNIYTKALKRCPDLLSNLIIPKLILEEENISHVRMTAMQKKQDTTCRVTQHPQTCFFYSMYEMKMNEIRFKRNMNLTTKEFPKNAKNKDVLMADFQLPIKQKEMLHIKGTFTKKNGEKIHRDWLFEDDYELYKTMRNLNYNIKDLKIKKTKLYKEKDIEKIKLFALFSAYNGGSTVITIIFEKFLKDQKTKIAKSCPENSKAKYCNYRKQIKNNKPLSHKIFIDDFREYIRSNYKVSKDLKPQDKINRRNEVADFYDNSLKDKNYLKNEDNFFKNHLKVLHKNNPDISEQDIDDFVEKSKRECSDL